MSQSLADEQDFMEEFMKREYSLVKPYRGKPSLPWDTFTQFISQYDYDWVEPSRL